MLKRHYFELFFLKRKENVIGKNPKMGYDNLDAL
jgi:hypothetical protein